MFYVAGFFSLHNIWHQYRLAELRRTVLSCTAAMSKLTNSTHSAAIEARRFIPTSPLFTRSLKSYGIAGVQRLVFCRPFSSSVLPNKQMWLKPDVDVTGMQGYICFQRHWNNFFDKLRLNFLDCGTPDSEFSLKLSITFETTLSLHYVKEFPLIISNRRYFSCINCH